MSIGMPGGSAREGVCIAAGFAAVGGACEQRKENGVVVTDLLDQQDKLRFRRLFYSL
jgi:hypothetical protein